MKKNHDIRVLLTFNEKKELKRKAYNLGLKMGQYIRMCCLSEVGNEKLI